MWPNLQETGDLVTFTEEILNGKLHFFVQWRPEVSLKAFRKMGTVSTLNLYDVILQLVIDCSSKSTSDISLSTLSEIILMLMN